MKPLQNKEQLGNRLLGYTMAAGALTGLAGNAHAQVAYSGPQNVTISMGGSTTLDLDGDGTNDFGFMVGGSSYATSSSLRYAVMMNASGAYSNSWLAGYTATSYRLMVQGIDDAGLISSGAGLWANVSNPAPLGAFGDRYYSVTSLYSTNVDLHGNFPGQTRFAGIRFMIGGSIHYGWIRVSLALDVSQLTIHDWAYETTPGAGISADASGPVATLTPDVYSRTNIQEATVSVTFDEDVSGLDISDFVVTNGLAGSLIEVTPGLEYNLEVMAGVHGMVTLSLPAGAVTDTYGNENDASSVNWFYDNRIPETTLSVADDITNTATQVVSVVFSEEIVDLTLGDFAISNGSAANLIEVLPNKEYTVEVTATADGVVELGLPAGSIRDYGNNPNEAVAVSWTYDNTQPAITLTAGQTGFTNQETVVVNIVFNEEVTGFTLEDISGTNGTASNLVEITPGLAYTVDVTADAEGVVSLEVPGTGVSDLAGNEGSNSNIVSWTYDAAAPVLSLDNGLTGPTADAAIILQITASESVLDLTITDILVTNGSATNLTEVTPGLEYTVEITAAASGEVTVGLPAAAVTDEGGNPNEEVSIAWVYDGTAPAVTLDAGIEVTNMATISLTVDFNEEVSLPELTDFSVTNGTASNLVEVSAGTSFTVDITAVADGPVVVELLAGSVSDGVGNENAAAGTEWEYDGTAPVATVDAGVSGTTDQQTTTVAVSFSEDVEGLGLADFDVTNGTAANLVTVTLGTSYTVDITAVAEGEVTVGLTAGAVTDAAGNENEAVSDSYTYETGVGLNADFDEGIRMYPNPANGFLNIELPRVSNVRIITASGRLVMVREQVFSEILDISNLSQGMYIIQIENDNGLFSQRFVVE